MHKSLDFIKTTIIGGLIFLIPFVLVVVVVGKAVQIMRGIAGPLQNLISINSIAGISLINLIAIILVILICFIAGLLARSSAGKRSFVWVDSRLITLIPGYSLIKGFTGSIEKDKEKNQLKPVLVKFDDVSQLGFEIQRLNNGTVAVFLPDSPDARTGTVVYITNDRVELLDIDFSTAFRILRSLGHGSDKFI